MSVLNLFRHCQATLYKFLFPPSHALLLLATPHPQLSLLTSTMTHLLGNPGCRIRPAYINAVGQAGNSEDYAQQLIPPLSQFKRLSWGKPLCQYGHGAKADWVCLFPSVQYALREPLPASASLLGARLTGLCKTSDFYFMERLVTVKAVSIHVLNENKGNSVFPSKMKKVLVKIRSITQKSAPWKSWFFI